MTITDAPEPPGAAPAAPSGPPAPPGAPASILGRELRTLTVGSIALVALTAFESLAVSTAMPTVARALDGVALYAVAFAGTIAAGIVSTVAAGTWTDRRGPAPALWTGAAMFVAGLVIAGTAQAMWTMIAGRIVQGLGAGLLTVSLYVLVGRRYPENLRPRVFAGFSAAWVVPSIVGPALAGFIVEHLTWRLVFLIVPLLAVPAALLVRPALRGVGPETAGPDDGRPALGGLAWAVVAAASALLLQYGGQQSGAAAAGLLALALAGVVTAAWRLLPRGTFTVRRGLPAVMVLRALTAAAFATADVFIPLMLSRERGLSPMTAGLSLTIGAVFWSVGSFTQSRRQDLSRTVILRLGLGSIALGVASVALALVPAVPVAVAMAGWSFAGFGMGMTMPTLSVLVLSLSGPRESGTNTASLQLSDSLASASALALAGSLFAALVDRPGPAAFVPVYALAATVAVAGTLLAGRVAAPPP